jgi:hypothetical protein
MVEGTRCLGLTFLFISNDYMKNLLCVILFCGVIPLCPAAQETLEEQKPTALFSAVFWGKPASRSLSYAPWGNMSELNSTKFFVQVAYGSLSRKCAYYGEGNIKFHQRKNLNALEMEMMKNENEFDKTTFFTELPFTAIPEKTREFIALFSPSDNKGNYKGYLVPFEQEDIPWGCYQIFSQFNETLYIAAAAKKLTLEPGKSLIVKSEEFKGQNRVKMLIYRNINGKYVESGAQNFSVNNRQRGIFFMTKKRSRVEIVPLIESKRPIEQVIGYGVGPILTPVELLEPTLNNSSEGI